VTTSAPSSTAARSGCWPDSLDLGPGPEGSGLDAVLASRRAAPAGAVAGDVRVDAVAARGRTDAEAVVECAAQHNRQAGDDGRSSPPTIADLFTASRPTVYRVLERHENTE
jgi:hypothetical protein